ncbi:MAG: permease, partial [Desulfobulbaceae bacterium]|nr:permease [Desulfobulbaceae bacterium]
MLFQIFFAGWVAVQDYIATHVLTCLVPAFFLAGAMVTFVDRNLVIGHLGERASKLKSFSLAAGGSFLVAACSCTVIPVASGLYFAGAGVGVAFILLWTAPSSNILSLVYTGNILGPGMVVARVVAALIMAAVVGVVMSAVFAGEQGESSPASTAGRPDKGARLISRRDLVLLVLLLCSLLLPNYLVINKPYIYKIMVWGACAMAVAMYAWKMIEVAKIQAWLRETWWFAKTIFPLL